MDISTLNERLQRIYNSVSLVKNDDLSGIKIETNFPGEPYFLSLDFNGASTESELKNIVFSLISNIAVLKDYIKNWCLKNGKELDVENVINTNNEVAIIHDLNNTEKHAELDRSPRSGFYPQLKDLKRALLTSVIPGTNSSAGFTLTSTGEMRFESNGTGAVKLIVDGNVVDENGNFKGKILNICDNAISVWESELRNLGVIA